MIDHCLAWNNLPETVTPAGTAKRTIPGVGADLVRIAVPAGTSAGRHSHPHEQFVQVISGSGILETEQGERAFGPGSVFHFPAGAWHAARFEADTVLVEVNLRDG